MKAEPLNDKGKGVLQLFQEYKDKKSSPLFVELMKVKSAVEYLRRYVKFDVFSQMDTPENYDKLMAKIDESFGKEVKNE